MFIILLLHRKIMKQKSTTLQFPEAQMEEMEMYVEEGYYPSKAELVRDAVRKRLLELKEDKFYQKILKMRQKAKSRGAKLDSPFISEKDAEEVLQKLLEKKGLKL